MQERNTIQKQIVLNAVRKMQGLHPSTLDIYLHINKTHPSISKSTVYRIIKELSEKGEITPMISFNDLERYDNKIEPHYHFRCKVCGTIFDVEMDVIKSLENEVYQKHGHQVDRHDIVFMGTCNKCKQR